MNKFNPGDRCEVHIKSIDRWRPATILTAYPGHGGHMVITDGGRQLHAKRGELRAPGESEWLRAVTVTPDPHSTAYQGEVGDHQPQYTDSGDGTGTVSVEVFPHLRTRFIGRDEYRHLHSRADDILKRDPNYGHDTGGSFTKPRNTEPGVPTPPNPVVTPGDIHNKIGPFTTSTLENAHFAKKYGHVHKDDEISTPIATLSMPGATMHEAYESIKESLKEFTHRVVSLGMLTESDNVARYEKARADMSNKYGVSYKDQSRYLDALEIFVQMAFLPDALDEYLLTIARLHNMGVSPRELDDYGTQWMRNEFTKLPSVHDTLPNITAAYKGSK